MKSEDFLERIREHFAKVGERSKAVCLIELTHEGLVITTYKGSHVDVGFLSLALQRQINQDLDKVNTPK